MSGDRPYITRDTTQPTTAERMARWFQRSANIRAQAQLGAEHTLTIAPRIVPAARPCTVEAIIQAVTLYCESKRYGAAVKRDAANAALLRWRHGASAAEAIRAGKVRADFIVEVYGPQGAA